MRDRRRATTLVVASMLTIGLLAALGSLGLVADRVAAAPHHRLEPVLGREGFADPSVAAFGHRYVAVSTGRRTPRAVAPTPSGPWRLAGHALAYVPKWASGNAIWGPDLVQTPKRWLLYFSAPVRGLGAGGRCIGVATSASPLKPFKPVGKHPLVCPARARTPQAYDDVERPDHTLPRSGVIDPAAFKDRDGSRYLLYRTQRLPSTIRLLRLRTNGLGAGQKSAPGYSRTLVRGSRAVENPALVRHGDEVVLFTSEKYFGGCHYQTTWRRSAAVRDFTGVRQHLLLRRSQTGVCGPGGADLVISDHASPTLFFNGWFCLRGDCPPDLDVRHDRSRLKPQRAMYAAHFRWTRHGNPVVKGFLTPR